MTLSQINFFVPVYISIHMPHTWHDGRTRTATSDAAGFQSTCHIRGMTYGIDVIEDYRNISIHMPHTWHDCPSCACCCGRSISIHMPHTWHDLVTKEDVPHTLISIHMPHTWHDSIRPAARSLRDLFQSTCHIRGMTFPTRRADRHLDYFNPHATYVA